MLWAYVAEGGVLHAGHSNYGQPLDLGNGCLAVGQGGLVVEAHLPLAKGCPDLLVALFLHILQVWQMKLV